MRYGIPCLALALLALSACQPHDASTPSASASTHATAATAPAAVSRAPAATVIRRNGATTVINPFHAVSRVSASPPGVFKFSRQATYKSMGAIPATVLALYPVKLEDGSPGHLIVVKGEEHGQLWSVVQPDVEEFTLHAGERVISVRYAQYNRILPFNAPAPATGG